MFGGTPRLATGANRLAWDGASDELPA
ncbi:MAG: hypothetical protein ACR2F6_06940 [Mycobacteriales bacterium]